MTLMLTTDTIKATDLCVDYMRQDRHVWHGAERMLESAKDDPTADAELLSRLRQLVYGGQVNNRVFEQWETEGREALAMHPDLVEEVTKATSGKIPLHVVHTLPYINPLVVFPEPLVYQTGNPNTPEVNLRGYLCYGKSNSWGELCDTNDPDMTSIAALLFVEIPEARFEEKKVKDLDILRISFQVSEEAKTMEEHVDHLTRNFQWQDIPGMEDYVAKGTRTEYMRWCAAQMLSTMLYLCSVTLDVEVVPNKRRAKKGRKPVKRFHYKLSQVGWQIGPALVRQRIRYLEEFDKERTAGSGKPQLPQHRRAHMKTVWCGPGRKIPKMTLVAAYWTRRDEVHLRPKTIHRVPMPK